MDGKMMAISILLLWVFATAVNPWNSAQARDYTQDIKAMEHRISQVEITLKELSGLLTKDAEGTLEFYQETVESIKRLSATMDSLERRMSEAEKRQMEFKVVNSRAVEPKARMPELENGWAVAKGRKANIIRLGNRAERDKQLPRSVPMVRVFVFGVCTSGRRTEIRYYTTRDMFGEDIRLPTYLTR